MVYVLNKYEKPLMPCSNRKARLLLSKNQARVIYKTPFTIQLIQDSTGYKQRIIGGLDTGSAVVGCAATANGKVVYQSEVTLRNDVSNKIKARATFRRTRRGKKTRYRKARFNNRSSSYRKGRLSPSIKSKIDSHIREVKFVEAILPIAQWIFELASFDIHKITNPNVTGKEYQNGVQKDFYNVKQYILYRDNYSCQSTQKNSHSKKLQIHHIHFKSNGGSDAPSNLITLCKSCHKKLHEGIFELKGKKSNTKHATEMGIIKSQLSQSSIKHKVTFGYETKFKREQYLKLDKTHANDAIAICLRDGEIVQLMETILIKKHISKGDYKQTVGYHSEKKIPTGKLFGFRKGDKVMTSKGVGFIKGKRYTGYFSVSDINNNIIQANISVKKITKISARSTTQIEEKNYVALNNFLNDNKTPEIEEFLKRIDRKVEYPYLKKLKKLVQEKGYHQVAEELGCTDRGLRKHIEKHTKKIVTYPNLPILKQMVTEKGYSQVARELGCSDRAVRKYIIKVDSEHIPTEKKKVNYPDIPILISMLTEKSFVQVGKELGCSDNAIRKYLKKNRIDIKSINVDGKVKV